MAYAPAYGITCLTPRGQETENKRCPLMSDWNYWRNHVLKIDYMEKEGGGGKGERLNVKAEILIHNTSAGEKKRNIHLIVW